jgi:hypothetical protein
MSETNRTTNDEQWHLPEPLQIALNPELIIKAEAQQRDWKSKAASPYGSLSPQEFERVRAVRMTEEMLRDLPPLIAEIHRLSISDPDGRLAEYERVRVNLQTQLAEALAIMGRFDEAARFVPDPEARANYLSILEAVMRPDSEDCGHSAKWKFVEKDVWSIRDEKELHLITCAQVMPDRSTCGFRNATTLPPVLKLQREARSLAHSIAGKLSPAEAKQALLNIGHTTEKLLK